MINLKHEINLLNSLTLLELKCIPFVREFIQIQPKGICTGTPLHMKIVKFQQQVPDQFEYECITYIPRSRHWNSLEVLEYLVRGYSVIEINSKHIISAYLLLKYIVT